MINAMEYRSELMGTLERQHTVYVWGKWIECILLSREVLNLRDVNALMWITHLFASEILRYLIRCSYKMNSLHCHAAGFCVKDPRTQFNVRFGQISNFKKLTFYNFLEDQVTNHVNSCPNLRFKLQPLEGCMIRLIPTLQHSHSLRRHRKTDYQSRRHSIDDMQQRKTSQNKNFDGNPPQKF